MYTLIFQRYLIFGVIGVETLLVPMMLEPSFYGELEYIRNLVFLSQFAFLGACSGYITVFFKYNIDLLADLKFMTIFCGLMVSFIAFLLGNNILIGLSCIAIVAAFYLETMAKVNKKYLVAIIYKPLFSMFLVVLAFILWATNFELKNPVYIVIMCAFFSLFSYFAVTKYVGINRLSLFGARVNKENIMKLVKEGFVVNIATALIVLNLFADRTWIKNYYPEQLPDYSFAINVSQFVILAITTFSYINQVELGEVFNKQGVNGLVDALKKKLFFGFLVYVVLVILYIPFIYVLSYFVSFNQFFQFAAITGILFGLSQLLFSINIALAYISKFKIVVLLCFGFLLLNVFIDYFIVHFSFSVIWLLMSTYMGFLLVGSIVITYILILNSQRLPEKVIG